MINWKRAPAWTTGVGGLSLADRPEFVYHTQMINRPLNGAYAKLCLMSYRRSGFTCGDFCAMDCLYNSHALTIVRSIIWKNIRKYHFFDRMRVRYSDSLGVDHSFWNGCHLYIGVNLTFGFCWGDWFRCWNSRWCEIFHIFHRQQRPTLNTQENQLLLTKPRDALGLWTWSLGQGINQGHNTIW